MRQNTNHSATFEKRSLFDVLRERLNDTRITPYLFLTPFLLFFVIFWVWPIAYSFYLSLLNTRGRPWVFSEDFVNWNRLLNDPQFHNALKNTLLILAGQVPLMLSLALLLALAFNSNALKFKAFYRFAFFAPLVLGAVPYSAIFRLIFNTQYGVLNYGLELFGFDRVAWLTSSTPALITIIIAMTWRWTGYNAIIILTGVQSVPEQLYEAAKMDGAGAFRIFWSITLPLLRPVLLFTLVLSTIGTLQLFTEPWLITITGPAGATETLGTYLYKQGFRSFNFGYASAIGYTIAIMAAIVSVVQIRLVGNNNS
jgi:lactose/L-arabinose transport system permease protein